MLAAVGIGLTILGIVIGVLATRRWGSRRARLLFGYRSTALLPAGDRARNVLELTYRGIPVANPHLVTVAIRNVGPADIGSVRFDGGAPLAIELQCETFFGLTGSSHPNATMSSAIGGAGLIEVGPLLLRRGEQCTFEAVVEGDVSPSLTSTLVDTDIVDAEKQERREWLAGLFNGLVLTLPMGGGVRIGPSSPNGDA